MAMSISDSEDAKSYIQLEDGSIIHIDDAVIHIDEGNECSGDCDTCEFAEAFGTLEIKLGRLFKFSKDGLIVLELLTEKDGRWN